MRVSSRLATTALLLSTIPALASIHFRHKTATSVHHAAASKKTVAHVQAIDSDRATAIQQALIQRGYLSGAPTGQWDSQTADAMKKLQGDNGWQTKITPDSRALIKLGLGGANPTTASAPEAALPGAQ